MSLICARHTLHFIQTLRLEENGQSSGKLLFSHPYQFKAKIQSRKCYINDYVNPNNLTQFHSLTFSLGVGCESFRTFSKDSKNFKHLSGEWKSVQYNNPYCCTALRYDCFAAVMDCVIGLI